MFNDNLFATPSEGYSNDLQKAIVSRLPRQHRQVPTRVYFALLSLLFVVIGCVEPESLIYKVNNVTGTASYLNSCLMALTSLVILCDVTFNDILPERFRFFFDRRHRYIVFCVLGLTYLTYALLFVKASYSPWTATVYVLLGIWAATIAVMDVVYEIKDGGARA